MAYFKANGVDESRIHLWIERIFRGYLQADQSIADYPSPLVDNFEEDLAHFYNASLSSAYEKEQFKKAYLKFANYIFFEPGDRRMMYMCLSGAWRLHFHEVMEEIHKFLTPRRIKSIFVEEAADVAQLLINMPSNSPSYKNMVRNILDDRLVDIFYLPIAILKFMSVCPPEWTQILNRYTVQMRDFFNQYERPEDRKRERRDFVREVISVVPKLYIENDIDKLAGPREAARLRQGRSDDADNVWFKDALSELNMEAVINESSLHASTPMFENQYAGFKEELKTAH